MQRYHTTSWGQWRRGTQVYKGQVTKKKVHRSVESGINPYESDRPQVTAQSDKIDIKKKEKEDNLPMEMICEAREKKFSHCCLIYDLPLVICNQL